MKLFNLDWDRFSVHLASVDVDRVNEFYSICLLALEDGWNYRALLGVGWNSHSWWVNLLWMEIYRRAR